MWCKYCGEPRYRGFETKLATDNSIRCIICGQRCRIKPKYEIKKRQARHPYIKQTGKPHQYVKEIKELGKERCKT